MRRTARFALAALLAIWLAGCGDSHRTITSPTTVDPGSGAAEVSRLAAPQADRDVGSKGFVPLEPGDRWRYAGRRVQQVFPSGSPPLAPVEQRYTLESELVCRESRGGVDYVVEKEVTSEGYPALWLRWRQDRAGLWRADVSPSEPAACGSNLPTAALERLRLSYPLHPGRTWEPVPGSGVIWRVEASEVLELPAGRFVGWRILVQSPGDGPQQWTRLWYGRQGLLKYADHLETVARDAAGSVVQRTVLERIEDLEHLELAGR